MHTMMTNRKKVLEYLSNIQKSICDDCLASELNFPQRQVANRICNDLSNQGITERQTNTCLFCKKVKLVNRISEIKEIIKEVPQQSLESTKSERQPWYWEGNIQSSIVSWLSQKGYKIYSVANTRKRNPGKDIIAESSNGKRLWISVKGYPEKSPHPQARHWFAQAIFDLILYREEYPSVDLAIGLPYKFVTYINLSKKVGWLKKNLPFKIFWVSQEGKVWEE